MTARPHLPPYQVQQLRILHQVQLPLPYMRFPQLQHLRPGQTIRRLALGLEDVVRQIHSPAPIAETPNNETLFQIFTPVGTPHSLGAHDNDEGGWQVWQGGGCYCINDNFCCDVDAAVPVSKSQNFWEQVEEDGQWGNAVAFY